MRTWYNIIIVLWICMAIATTYQYNESRKTRKEIDGLNKSQMRSIDLATLSGKMSFEVAVARWSVAHNTYINLDEMDSIYFAACPTCLKDVK